MDLFFVGPSRAMRPVLRVLSRANAESASRASVPSRRSYASSLTRRIVTDSICLRCQLLQQHRAYSTGNRKPGPSISDHVRPGPNGGEAALKDAPSPSSPSPLSSRSSARSEPTSSTQDNDVLDSLPDLPSAAEDRRTQTSKRFTHLMDNFQNNIFIASQRLNDLTGYSGIEALKASIEAQEALAAQTRARVRAAKDAYTTAIAQRSASQREVNELLQRKHAWTSADLERFTALYRSDHANEQAEQAASDALAAAESQAEETASRLSKSILARYHEEQIWSDKIRRMSTWGTWGLMGVNILLFVVFQVAVEPWRRKRLVSGFEEKVREALESEKSGPAVAVLAGDEPDAADTESSVPKMGAPLAVEHQSSSTHPPSLDRSATQTTHQSTSPILSTPLGRLRSSVTDLVSDRTVTLRKLDLTAAVVEGAAAGAAVVGVACWVLLLRRG